MRERIIKRNNVHLSGSGKPPILFAHGFGMAQETWRMMSPAFENDHHVTLFDYVGFGHSDVSAYDPERHNSLEGYAQDVVDIIRALGLPPVVHVGHSVGGLVGVLAANIAPGLFDRLVLLCSSPRYLNDPPEYFGGFEKYDVDALMDMMEKNFVGWARNLVPKALGTADAPGLRREIEEKFFTADPDVFRQFAELTFYADCRSDLPKVRCPCLVLQTQVDAMVPVEVAEYLHSHLPYSTLKVMEAGGHYPHMSDPEETARLLQHYIRN